MSQLPLDFSDVLDAFQTPAPVLTREITGARAEDGTWNGPATEWREIKAVVFQANLEELQIIAEGEIADGAITLHTTEEMFFTTEVAAGVVDKQSFVRYQGRDFRVIAEGFMHPLAGYRTYHAVRYNEAGVDPEPDGEGGET